MNKKGESALLRSFRNPNAFKKKSNKLVDSLSSSSYYSLQTPQRKENQLQSHNKTKVQAERCRQISTEYALNYVETENIKLSKKRSLTHVGQKTTFKNAKLVLNSAFDVGSETKSSSLLKIGQQRKIKRNLSVSGSAQYLTLKNKGESLSNQYALPSQSQRKRQSFMGKTVKQELLEQNIKQLEKTKKQNQKMLEGSLKKIQISQENLEEERQKFLMIKSFYLEQIRKLSECLQAGKSKSYNFPISSERCSMPLLKKSDQQQSTKEYFSGNLRKKNRRRKVAK